MTAATYDPSTDAGRVRLLISDIDVNQPTFGDDEIDAFLAIEDGDVRRAAATALEAIAGNEVLVQKRIRLLDKQTDGPAESRELRELAASLRAQSDANFEVEVIPQVQSTFGWRDQIHKNALRGL